MGGCGRIEGPQVPTSVLVSTDHLLTPNLHTTFEGVDLLLVSGAWEWELGLGVDSPGQHLFFRGEPVRSQREASFTATSASNARRATRETAPALICKWKLMDADAISPSCHG